MDTECPDPLDLARMVDGALPEEARQAIEAHLVECEACAQHALELALAVEEDEKPGARAGDLQPYRSAALRTGWPAAGANPRIRRFSRTWAAVAAAGLVCAAGATALWIGGGRKPAPAPQGSDLPPASWGRTIRGSEEAFQTGPAGEDRLVLPDGTRLRLERNSHIRFEAPSGGDRARIRIEKGGLEAWVSKGEGDFRLLAPAGEVQVLGTQFKVRSFTFRERPDLLPGFASGPVLHVEVQEGRILLKNGRGAVAVAGGSQGVSFPDGSPILLQQAGARQTALDRFARNLSWDRGHPSVPSDNRETARLMAALFWAARGDAPQASDPAWDERQRLAAALLEGVVSE